MGRRILVGYEAVLGERAPDRRPPTASTRKRRKPSGDRHAHHDDEEIERDLRPGCPHM
jgi:hypothetical protein